MRIRVKLYATLRQYVPNSADLPVREEGWEVADGATLGDVVKMVNLPDGLRPLTLVNGAHCNDQGRILKDGDALLLYPLMAGG
jgi:molybdopterin converting factor small subunit